MEDQIRLIAFDINPTKDTELISAYLKIINIKLQIPENTLSA